MAKAVTVYQYEQPRCPEKWNESERRFYSRVIEALDDIYSKYGRIDEKMLSSAVVDKVNSAPDAALGKLQDVYASVTVDDLMSNSLTASTARIVELAVEKAVASEIVAGTLAASLAKFVIAQIGVANIDYAQIVDIYANRIFTDSGMAGKFRIDGLEVSSAQIVDLIVNSFRIVSSDGKVYKVSVGANGDLVTEYLEDQGSWMDGQNPPNGYSVVASDLTVGEVTSGKLYVSGAAEIMKLTAKYLSADTAFINELTSGQAFIDQIVTNRIYGNRSLEFYIKQIESAPHIFRQENFPDGESDVRLNDLLVIPSTGAQYQAADVSDIGLRFAMDAEGNLYYSTNDPKSYYLEEIDGELYAGGFSANFSQYGDIGSAYAWIAVHDGDALPREEFRNYVRFDGTALYVGAQNGNGAVRIDDDSVDVIVGGKQYSSFGSNYVEFGNYQLRRTADSGLGFKMR